MLGSKNEIHFGEGKYSLLQFKNIMAEYNGIEVLNHTMS